MAIPQSQLETWSHPGSTAGSANTHAAIRGALSGLHPLYQKNHVDIYLQGSYGNSTHVRVESDVDIVVCLTDVVLHDTSRLSPACKAMRLWNHASPDVFRYFAFRNQVHKCLASTFGASSVIAGSKCIKVLASGSRRNADILCCHSYVEHSSPTPAAQPRADTGVCFYPNGGSVPVTNFPKHHLDNCTAKNQRTGEEFKSTVRVFKNLRRRLEDNGVLATGVAPSYFLECMLFNVPDQQYAGRLGNTVFNILKWLTSADASRLVCANQRRMLLGSGSTYWTVDRFRTFVQKAIAAWNGWR